MKYTKLSRWLAAFLLLIMVSSLSSSAFAQAGNRFFGETGKTVNDPFLGYWNTHGSLAQQGYPITNLSDERNDADGNTYQTQYFERARFEFHPEVADPNFKVLLGLLGREALLAKYPSGSVSAPSEVVPGDGNRTFSETGKTVSGLFLAYWNTHGGLAQQGYPITQPFFEINEADGQQYITQYFERARFEYHPEQSNSNFKVLLGLVGREVYQRKQNGGSGGGGGGGGGTPPTNTPVPGATNTPVIVPVPQRIAPLEGAVLNTRNVSFQWQPISYPGNPSVLITCDLLDPASGNWSNVIDQRNLPGTSYSATLPADGTYRWRMRTHSDLGDSLTTSFTSFRVVSSSAPPPATPTATPTPVNPTVSVPVPSKISPVNGAVLRTYPRTTTFSWNPVAVTGADSIRYNLEVEIYGAVGVNQWTTFRTQLGINGTTANLSSPFTGDNNGRWRVWATATVGGTSYNGERGDWSNFSFNTSASQYAGNWYNDNMNTNGITRLDVTNAGQSLTVHGYGSCSPSDCDWGTHTGTFNGEPFSILFDLSTNHQLTFSLNNAGDQLKVVDVGSASGSNTYYFHRLTAARFSANWINEDAATRGITRLNITASGNTLTIHGYGSCSPTDCDWSTRTVTFNGEPVSVLFDFGGGLSDQLSLSFQLAGRRLKVVDVGSRSGTNIYYFHR